MSKKNYYLKKDNKSGEIIYMEFDKIKGYNITPKTKIEDAIKVDKIVFVNPSFSEKIIKKKIDIKIRQLLKELTVLDENGGDDEDGLRRNLMEAERLKLNILNNYVKYLGHTYESLTLRKVQVIINQLRIKLYNSINKRRSIQNENLYYLDEDEYRDKGRGR